MHTSLKIVSIIIILAIIALVIYKLFDIGGSKARYVSFDKVIRPEDNGEINIAEIRIFDKDGKYIPITDDQVTASNHGWGKPKGLAVDNDNSTFYNSSGFPVGEKVFFRIDLGRDVQIKKIELVNRMDGWGKERMIGGVLSLWKSNERLMKAFEIEEVKDIYTFDF